MNPPREATRPAAPVVAAVDMGYGHLRAALPLARFLGVELCCADVPPLAGPDERRLWNVARLAYTALSRVSQLPLVGAPLRAALESLTDIPHLHPSRDLSTRTLGAMTVDALVRAGLGRGVIGAVRAAGGPLLTTFFTPAIAADRAGCRPVLCVVTDTDVSRVWAPIDSGRTRIRYLVPTLRAARRLAAYGVPRERIEFTGFPLPHELAGGPDLRALRANLALRLGRLDPGREFRRAYRDEVAHFLGEVPEAAPGEPPHLVFAVGGAGAQAGLAARFLPRLRPLVADGRLRLTLVAGLRHEVAERFRRDAEESGSGALLGRGIEILEASSFEAYYDAFNALLARADVLWTKPSELTFYAALGLPVVCAWPVGAHERYNRRWVVQSGAGLVQGDPRYAADWLEEWLQDGTLAGAAWSGYMRLPKFGLYRIAELVREEAARPDPG